MLSESRRWLFIERRCWISNRGKILYDSLMSADRSWVKKATGLDVTEFMLRIMAWLCTKDGRRNQGLHGYGYGHPMLSLVHYQKLIRVQCRTCRPGPPNVLAIAQMCIDKTFSPLNLPPLKLNPSFSMSFNSIGRFRIDMVFSRRVIH